MLYLENYQWELHHFKICVSYVNVSKYDSEKFQAFYIQFILWPTKMFTLLRVENSLFFGKNTYSMENLLMLAKILVSLSYFRKLISFANAMFYVPSLLIELAAAIALEK